MNCHEFQDVMRQSVDGGLDSVARKEVALHLAGCQDCLKLIEGDKFWDEAIVDLLHRKAPSDLRSEILGDLDGTSVLGWKGRLKLIIWASRIRKPGVWFWVETVALVVLVVWLLPKILNW